MVVTAKTQIEKILNFLPTQVDLIFDGDSGFHKSCANSWFKKAIGFSDAALTEFQITNYASEDEMILSPFVPEKIVGANLQKPFFYYGVPSAVNSEYVEAENFTVNQTPLVWMLEPYSEVTDEMKGNVTTEIRLFVLDETDEGGWTTETHYSDVVKPMWNLAVEIVETLKRKQGWNIENYKITPRSRFGRVTVRGNEKKIIDEDLSGVELTFKATYSIESCKC